METLLSINSDEVGFWIIISLFFGWFIVGFIFAFIEYYQPEGKIEEVEKEEKRERLEAEKVQIHTGTCTHCGAPITESTCSYCGTKC